MKYLLMTMLVAFMGIGATFANEDKKDEKANTGVMVTMTSIEIIHLIPTADGKELVVHNVESSKDTKILKTDDVKMDDNRIKEQVLKASVKKLEEGDKITLGGGSKSSGSSIGTTLGNLVGGASSIAGTAVSAVGSVLPIIETGIGLLKNFL